MDCREFRDTFSDYLDGLLTAADEVRAREHLGACPECRRFERAYRTGVSAFQGLPPVGPSRDFGVRLLHRIRREPALPTFAGSYGFAGALLAVTVAGFLVLDLRERRRDAIPDAPESAEQASVPPTLIVDSGADVITVRVMRSDLDLPLSDPYTHLSWPGPSTARRVRFDVPAVWSGR
ncbi:MAG: zf-HC2 domain-containing protein [Gemmatimonadota bacterium]